MKLIRDLIPDDMRSHGCEPELRFIQGDELRKALLVKLAEECKEVIDSDGLDIRELADVYEVLSSLESLLPRAEWVDLIEVAERKRERRGGFMNGTLWINSEDDTTAALTATDQYRDAERVAESVPMAVQL